MKNYTTVKFSHRVKLARYFAIKLLLKRTQKYLTDLNVSYKKKFGLFRLSFEIEISGEYIYVSKWLDAFYENFSAQ